MREKSGWRAMAEGPTMRKWRWQAPRARKSLQAGRARKKRQEVSLGQVLLPPGQGRVWTKTKANEVLSASHTQA